MRELYQCTGCGWLTTIYRALTWTGKELLCSHCLERAKNGGSNV